MNTFAASFTSGYLPQRMLLHSYFRLFLGVTLLVAAAICWRYWPPPLPSASRLGYTSTASLLVLPQDRAEFAADLGVSGQSEIDSWLGSEEVFRHFLAFQHVHDAIARRLRHRPELEAYARTVMFTPTYVNGARRSAHPDDEAMNASKGPDYAVIAGTAIEREQHAVLPGYFGPRYQRINRILVAAQASNPADAKLIADTSVAVIQAAIQELATRKVLRQKAAAADYIRMTSKKVARAERNLTRLKGSLPDRVVMSTEDIPWLELTVSRLQAEVGDLERRVALLRSEPAADSELDAVAQERFKSFVEGQRLYMPGSQALQMLEMRYKAATDIARRLQAEQTARTVAVAQAELRARRRLLEDYQHRLQTELRLQPSAKVRQNAATALRELEGWEAELLSWQGKMVRIRLAEQIAVNDGTTVVLQSPLPGRKRNLATKAFWTRTQLLKYLPVAPLVGLLAVVMYHVWLDATLVPPRAVLYCDAPVLGLLPRPDPAVSRKWQRLKLHRLDQVERERTTDA